MRGARTRLRTTTEADLADHLRWHADPELVKWLPHRPRPQSLDQRREWLKEAAKDRSLVHWEIARDDKHLGYCAVRLIWPPMAEGWRIESLFLAPGARRQGFGRDAARSLHRYVVDFLGLRHGEAWLYRDDVAGRRVFEALGYTEFAHGRDVFYREGRWWDDWRGHLTAAEFRTRFPQEVEYPERTGRAG